MNVLVGLPIIVKIVFVISNIAASVDNHDRADTCLYSATCHTESAAGSLLCNRRCAAACNELTVTGATCQSLDKNNTLVPSTSRKQVFTEICKCPDGCKIGINAVAGLTTTITIAKCTQCGASGVCSRYVKEDNAFIMHCFYPDTQNP